MRIGQRGLTSNKGLDPLDPMIKLEIPTVRSSVEDAPKILKGGKTSIILDNDIMEITYYALITERDEKLGMEKELLIDNIIRIHKMFIEGAQLEWDPGYELYSVNVIGSNSWTEMHVSSKEEGIILMNKILDWVWGKKQDGYKPWALDNTNII